MLLSLTDIRLPIYLPTATFLQTEFTPLTGLRTLFVQDLVCNVVEARCFLSIQVQEMIRPTIPYSAQCGVPIHSFIAMEMLINVARSVNSPLAMVSGVEAKSKRCHFLSFIVVSPSTHRARMERGNMDHDRARHGTVPGLSSTNEATVTEDQLPADLIDKVCSPTWSHSPRLGYIALLSMRQVE
jgi:hypothetical protein